MNVGGEIIKLSFGPASNAITSHLTNLEGLACTSSSEDQDDPICDPYITHTIQKDQYVPRVLFVDTQNCFNPWPDLESNHSNHSQPSTWNGNVEIHHRQDSPQDIFAYKSTNNSMQNLHSNQVHAFDIFQQTANIMSHTSDRYHSSKYQHVSSQFVYSETIATDDGRTMKWDDEEEEEEELDEYTKERMKLAQLERQRKQEQELGEQMYSAWDTFLGQIDEREETNDKRIPSKQQEKEGTTKISSPEEMRQHALSSLQWMQYFMPPHPYSHMYSAPLPLDRNLSSNRDGNKAIDEALLHSFHMGKYASSSNFCSVNDLSMGITREWREDVLGDAIRKWMEDCDSIRGFQVLVDSDECLFGGLASSVLEELNDECRSAAKFSIVVQDGDTFVGSSGRQDEEEQGKSKYWRSENKAVAQFRNELNGGLLMHGITENSSLVLPLSVSKAWDALHKEKQNRNLFEASAAAAIGLENITLPFRLAHGSASKKSKIGIGNGFFQGTTQAEDDMFPSAERLSIHEFISSMKPSNRHIVTELSCLSRPFSPMQVHNALLQGTSIERRQLEEERNRNRNSYYRRTRGRDVDPGTWMEDEGGNCGILSSLSPVGVDAATTCRSMHQHFALSSSFRPLPSRVGDVISTYTTCMMEGMAIGYRPQSTIATVVGQCFNEMVGGKSNIAGSYWKHILGEQAPILQTLSTLGNSTRVYDHLKQTSNGLKSALSRKYSGYLSRDGMTGLAPESEDCDEAMEACLTLRDVYEPPSMGFDSDEEGYFEDNSD